MKEWGGLGGMIRGGVRVVIWIVRGVEEKRGMYEMMGGLLVRLIVV